MPPSLTLLALMSLLVVIPNTLPEPPILAGSLEGGFKPEGCMFSSCEGGRSIVNAGMLIVARCGRPDLSRKTKRSSQAIEGDTRVAIYRKRSGTSNRTLGLEEMHDSNGCLGG